MTSVLPDEAGPHWTRASRSSIRTAALRMMTAESFGYENFYKASDQLCLGVAEESFRSRISRGDTAIGIRYNNSIHGC
jgi:hypothetical protein